MKTLVSEQEVYIKLRNLMEDPNSNIEDFTEVVSCCPKLTSAILQIVNSAFFGLPGPIDSIGRSVNLLGIGQLYDLVLGLSEMGSLDRPSNLAHLPQVGVFAPEMRWV